MGGNNSKEKGPNIQNWPCQRNLRILASDDSYEYYDSGPEECAIMSLENTDWKWPKGRVPYKIDKSLQEYPELMSSIQQAIDQFHLQTPIKFVQLPQDQDEDHYVIFMFDEIDISSDVGRQKEPQIVNISLEAEKGIVMHELMHVLGFYHEQSRKDRNQYVEISKDIPDEVKQNYEFEGHAIGSYDPDSIMHYGVNQYMKANQKLKDRMGQREGFSSHDLMGLEYLYGEPKCSYDIFGEEYFIQANYECITCWGEDSAYSICEFCRNKHHSNCKTIEHSFKDMNEKGIKSVCDCGRNKHRAQICTKEIVRGKSIEQNMYLCISCYIGLHDFKSWWDYRKKGVCKICIDKFHSGHIVKSLGKLKGICARTQPMQRSSLQSPISILIPKLKHIINT